MWGRQDLEDAIRQGKIQGGSVSQIADAIQASLDRERQAREGGPAKAATEPPPPSLPRAIIPADEVPSEADPAAVEDLDPPRETSGLVFMPSSQADADTEFHKAKAAQEEKGNTPATRQPIRLRSLSGFKASRKISLQAAIQSLEESVPKTLRFIPDGHTVEMVAKRNIVARPGVGVDKADYVAICFKNEKFEDDMTVQEIVSTLELSEGVDLKAILEKILVSLRHTYRARSPQLEPKPLPAPRLTIGGPNSFGVSAEEAGDTPAMQEAYAAALASGNQSRFLEEIRNRQINRIQVKQP